MRHALIISLLAGLGASFFYAPSAFCCSENESLVRKLETVPMDMWDVYTEGCHKDTIYITDYDLEDRAEFVTIYSDGVVYAGKNRVQLHKKHIRRIKRLYSRIKKYKSEDK